MAGGSPAPTDTTDTTSHINTEYDSDEDGQVEKADDAATLGGKTEGNLSVDHASTAGDADTVDGNHASQLGATKVRRTGNITVGSAGGSNSDYYNSALPVHIEASGTVTWHNGTGAGTARANIYVYVDGGLLDSRTVASESSSGTSSGSTQFELSNHYENIGDGTISQVRIRVTTSDPDGNKVTADIDYGVLQVE